MTGRDWREGRSHHRCQGWGALGEHILQKSQREGAVRRICARGPWGSSLKQFGATSPSPRHILILLVTANGHAQAFVHTRMCAYLGGRGTEQKGGRRMTRQRAAEGTCQEWTRGATARGLFLQPSGTCRNPREASGLLPGRVSGFITSLLKSPGLTSGCSEAAFFF